MTAIRPQQNLADIAVQQYGTLEAVVQLAFENNMSITDELEAGSELEEVVYTGKKNDIAAFYDKNAIFPATSLTDADFDIIDNEDPCNLCKCFT